MCCNSGHRRPNSVDFVLCPFFLNDKQETNRWSYWCARITYIHAGALSRLSAILLPSTLKCPGNPHYNLILVHKIFQGRFAAIYQLLPAHLLTQWSYEWLKYLPERHWISSDILYDFRLLLFLLWHICSGAYTHLWPVCANFFIRKFYIGCSFDWGLSRADSKRLLWCSFPPNLLSSTLWVKSTRW